MKKYLSMTIAIVLLSATVILSVTMGSAPVFFGYSSKILPIYCTKLPDEQKAVSLTFDAAYGNEQTIELLDTLDEYGVKATFFLCGIWVEDNTELTKEISNRGHEIGTHSYTHPDMAKISAESIKKELTDSANLIKQTTGKDVPLFRPPFGSYNDRLIKTATELGYYTIQWDVDSIDWKGYSATNIAERVLKKVKSGSIILFHNDAKHVLGGIRIVADKLKKDGYEFRTVSNLIIKDNFTIDYTGRQVATAK
jgi:polysaccharide deacetylase family sporulation protein PdaB